MDKLNLESLEVRRDKLCLKFAIKYQKNPHENELFKPKEKKHKMILRHTETYKVNIANTNRYQNSAVPYMQRLLNEHDKNKYSKETPSKTP